MTSATENALASVDRSLVENIVQHGEYLVNADTGEVVGFADAERQQHFRVEDQDSAEWVLRRLTEAEAEIVAVRKRREVLLANLDKMEAEHQRRADYLKFRFSDELQGWAASALHGQKKRSLVTPFGTLAFRKTPGKVKVLDEDAAVEWARANAPGAVKETAKVLVSMLDPAAVPEGEAFHVEGPGESFSVRTGLL